MQTPEEIKEHSPRFYDNAWENYSLQELGSWVHLFVKRAYHRREKDKIRKDLTDAENYLQMMQSHINEAKETLL